MVNVDVAPFAPVCTVAGENEQVMAAGRFAHPSVTAWSNAPPTALTVTGIDVDVPRVSDTVEVPAATPKSVTVMLSVTGEESTSPSLATIVTCDVPNGSVRFGRAPEVVPFPSENGPVQR